MERYRPIATTGRLKKKPRGKPFPKGSRPPGSGRKQGSQNKMTTLVKDAITGAGAAVGMPEPLYAKDRRTGKPYGPIIGWKATGKGGLQGYLTWLSLYHPQSMAALIGKVLPLQVHVGGGLDLTVAERFSNADISQMSLDEKIAAYREVVSLTKPVQGGSSPAPSNNVRALPSPRMINGDAREVQTVRIDKFGHAEAEDQQESQKRQDKAA